MKRIISLLLIAAIGFSLVITAAASNFTTADALAILRHVAGVEMLSPSDTIRYDFNKDGNINTSNAIFILRVIAGIEEFEETEEEPMTFNIPVGVPAGFIPLNEAIERLSDVISVTFWSTQIMFMDSEGRTVYTTNSSNEDLFFFYRGDSGTEQYMKNDKFFEIVEVAKLMSEQRSKTYTVGETIEIRGAEDERFNITFISVELNEIEDLKRYIINFSISPSVTQNERRNFSFGAVTTCGINYDINFISSNSMSVEIRRPGVELGEIILRSPEYRGLMYRVVL
ncbi:MAG: hypothetical protein LBD23_18780 [Oscillospiraceae bacterium]|jgi:hypothetical protein|nr:hypothetical protein [Oscillospiraceae bacterium]